MEARLGAAALAASKIMRRFAGDPSGSIAITSVIATIPLVLAIGGGIDYARAVSEKTQLQIGTDAAAITGIRAIRQGVTAEAAVPLMNAVIQADYLNPAAQVTKTTLSSNGTTLCVDSTSQVATAFMSMAGIKTVAVGAHACSAMNIDTFEIAFAIDNSGSMGNSAQNGQTKIAAARSAANALISALTPATGTTSNLTASYAVVPFAASVNVGAGNASASWMDTTAASSIHWNNYLRPSGVALPASRFAMFKTMSTTWGGCVEERPAPYTVSDDPATSAKPDTLFVPMLYPDEQDGNGWAYNSYLQDEGGTCRQYDTYYTADRNSPGRGDGQTKLCKYKATPRSTNYSSYVNPYSNGPNIACTTKALSPLDATTSVTTAAIASMVPNGDTLLVSGFMWAWRTISPNGPFPGSGGTATTGPQVPKPYNYVNATTGANNHKVIILLTDGMNHWSGQANDSSYSALSNDPNASMYNALGFFGDKRLGVTTASNARDLLEAATRQACTNAKAVGVEIYTVGFLATDGIDDTGRQTLQMCASDTAHSFIAQDGNELVTVFQSIAATLTKPRIAK